MNTETQGRLITMPHPVLLEGRTNVPVDLIPGETLQSFLSRHIDLSESWEARIGGALVPAEHWERVRPKDGQVIEVTHAVNRQALYLVAMIALTYFTFGLGAGVGGAWGAAGGLAGSIGGVGGMMAATAVMAGGSALGGREIE